MTKIEYRVRPITRYIVTRHVSTEHTGANTQHGVFDNGETAYHVAYALCRAEHEKSGEPVESTNFIYPGIPDGVNVAPLG